MGGVVVPVGVAGVTTWARLEGGWSNWPFSWESLLGMVGRGGIGNYGGGLVGGGGGAGAATIKNMLVDLAENDCARAVAWAGANVAIDAVFGGSVLRVGGKAARATIEAGARWLGHELAYSTPEIALRVGGVRFLPKAAKTASNLAENASIGAAENYKEYLGFKAGLPGDLKWYDFIPYAASAVAIKDVLFTCFAGDGK